MKTIRKGISILVALAMIVTICAVESPKISQAGVKVIVGKKLNVEITDTDTIVVKGKAKAKSANKKIAKVDSITKYEKNSNIHISSLKIKLPKLQKEIPQIKELKSTVLFKISISVLFLYFREIKLYPDVHNTNFMLKW